MKNQNIYCKFYDYNKKTFKEIEIDCNLNVFPCCYILIENTISKLKNYPCQNHNLNEKMIETIMSEINFHFNEEKWKIDPYTVCRKKCNYEN